MMRMFTRARVLTGRVCTDLSNWIAMDIANGNDGRDPGPSGDRPSGSSRERMCGEF